MDSIQKRTEEFAVRVIKTYSILKKRGFDDAIRILTKQFLRSGTSIGANCAEPLYAQSRNDMISKYSIAIKEASETQYWIRVMVNSETVTEHEFSLVQQEIVEIIKILTATINKLKKQ